ncbi:Ph Domain Leucine-Rich Repeat-Containing Protein Phosphatase 1, partial [Manis pentadactyla]
APGRHSAFSDSSPAEVLLGPPAPSPRRPNPCCPCRESCRLLAGGPHFLEAPVKAGGVPKAVPKARRG